MRRWYQLASCRQAAAAGHCAPLESLLQQRFDEDVLVVEEKHGCRCPWALGGWSIGDMAGEL